MKEAVCPSILDDEPDCSYTTQHCNYRKPDSNAGVDEQQWEPKLPAPRHLTSFHVSNNGEDEI